ncbi:D-alanyl-D-alanine carboxypeptidase (penicillin-binding protein 5/6) [Planifilum fulgidum]|jgi:D-alanyl-D-alanine carboxypeptidase (penicillin-binding protein 5/6)|uniref:serine-type D-Ala-D-Ala carboxypeptidase n=1 Tax=Planifilum fulgidum TaxID=201973 RepID=A0A1I2L4V9_9BACL|nr:D-alanyl-D-alanine carboxypeptidase family protein [Planifilum fulgidum]MBO2495781.1 D-alanyl-D-alanine carboxypeptidase [Bacillota bacterium]SFF74374.1 D-alanyl-D-alanine carboxypeptidase (penicillin-binding protein 5/6) [Planifilum fulgidum]
MRPRLCISLLVGCLFFAMGIPAGFAGERDLAPDARSAVLIDEDTGTVLFEKNSRDKLPPASITKIMTMLLVMEDLDAGKIRLDEKVRVSEHAASMGGSQIFLEPGEQMTVRDLLKAVAIASANDASVALAEHLAGTEEAFVERMNQRAKELGMTDTRFQNATGLSEPEHVTSARDIAIMSRELLKHPEITGYTRIYQDYLRKDTKKPFWLVNTNRLVRFYPGVDGLKTGYTSEAKYCLSATAKRGNFRVIAVVMGEPDPKTRNRDISRMLDFAFSRYTNHVVYKKGDLIGEVRVSGGDPHRLAVRSPQQLSILMKKGERAGEYKRKVLWENLKAPVRQGQKLGTVLIEKDGKKVAEMEIQSPREIPRAGLWTTIKRVTKGVLFFPEDARAPEEERAG